jgi:undecaprenyl-diphosphatase
MTTVPRNPLLRFLAWLGSHEFGLLLAVAGIAAGVLMFAEIADQVIDGGTQKLDRTILLSLRHPDRTPLGPRFVQESARDITALGSVTLLSLLTIGVCVLLALDNRKHMALFMAGSVASGLLLSTLLKHIFNRPRPDLVPYAVYVTTASFPSGHSMLSAVTYLCLGALLARAQPRTVLKAWFMLSAIAITFLVGLSRVYLGVHWPSDVLAGWTAGAVWALVCWRTALWLQHRRALESTANSERI